MSLKIFIKFRKKINCKNKKKKTNRMQKKCKKIAELIAGEVRFLGHFPYDIKMGIKNDFFYRIKHDEMWPCCWIFAVDLFLFDVRANAISNIHNNGQIPGKIRTIKLVFKFFLPMNIFVDRHHYVVHVK